MTDLPDNEARSYQAFVGSPKRSIKHSTYFAVYDHLFEKYRGRPITFVEIGVLDGGSLFMWREFFGPQARIIGVELNPGAAKWREHGFEIFIGSQSDPAFWRSFFDQVGPIDLLLDDGGHTYEQQIKTVEACVDQINDGGLLVIEDTHTSYMQGFGLKSLSLVKYGQRLSDRINQRFSELNQGSAEYRIWGVRFYESFVVLEINRTLASLKSQSIYNGGEASHELDFRYSNGGIADFLERVLAEKKSLWASPFIRPILKTIKKWATKFELIRRSLSVRRYF